MLFFSLFFIPFISGISQVLCNNGRGDPEAPERALHAPVEEP
jgi:hypothetical protein